jgi:hypothetical protein
MAAIQKGYGAVWSVGTFVFTGGIASASNPGAMQSVDAARNSQRTELKDNGGTIRGVCFHGFLKNLSISVVPYGTGSLSAGFTSSDAWLPQPGTEVTITDSIGAILDANFSVVTSRQKRTVDGYLMADLELETSDEGVNITTTVA